ncbi:MAG: hypothetical protein GY751_26745 [Bacteroidetes bacterium]|nr:hypothetical protein [Bacteroidota bacterium]
MRKLITSGSIIHRQRSAMRLYLFLLSILCLLLTTSCNSNRIACTEEFRTVGISVTGDLLTDHFTIREATSDTIRYADNSGFPPEDYYVVLDDNYQSEIAGSRENFRFIGMIGTMTVVDELFVIKADQCHISYVSGNTEIVL